jgi:hypothetical protein
MSPRYLAVLISRLDDAAQRQLLLSNMIEESGQYDAAALSTLVSLGLQAEWFVGKPHPELFRRFSRALTNQNEEGGDEISPVAFIKPWRLAIAFAAGSTRMRG